MIVIINHQFPIILFFYEFIKIKLWKNLSFMNVIFHEEVYMFQEYIDTSVLNCFLLKIHPIIRGYFLLFFSLLSVTMFLFPFYFYIY